MTNSENATTLSSWSKFYRQQKKNNHKIAMTLAEKQSAKKDVDRDVKIKAESISVWLFKDDNYGI